MSSIRIDAAAVSSKGLVRSNNEDNICLNGILMPLRKMDEGIRVRRESSRPTQLYAVCDGMGGMEGGEYASFAAVSALRRYTFSGCRSIRDALGEYCLEANEAVFHSADGRAGERHNGSTFACVAVHQGRAIAAHIGDSRVYRLHHGVFTQVTRDHSEVQRMVDLGFLTPEEAAVPPERHVITRFLGVDPNEYRVEATFSEEYPLDEGDRFLICSDGLSDMLAEQQIAALLRAEGTSLAVADALAQAALDAGGRDNVSVLVLTVCPGAGGSLISRLFARR